jgi:hypothetical protein
VGIVGPLGVTPASRRQQDLQALSRRHNLDRGRLLARRRRAMLIPSGAPVERSSGARVERAKVWAALNVRPLKVRASPSGNRARPRRTCSPDLSGGVEPAEEMPRVSPVVKRIGNVSWV